MYFKPKNTAHVIDLECYVSYIFGIPKYEVSE